MGLGVFFLLLQEKKREKLTKPTRKTPGPINGGGGMGKETLG